MYIDAAQLEASVQFVAPALLQFSANGRAMGREGNKDPDAAPHGVYRCRGEDRWCAITVLTDAQWRGFCQALADQDWTGRPEFATLDGRQAHENELDALVEAWTSRREAGKVMETLQRHGVPAGVANNGRDLGENPQFIHDQYYTRLDHPEMGQVDYAAHSIDFSRSPQVVRRSPCLGEHTEYVCRRIIGLDEQEYQSLADAGVFE
jgi:benzylsuccinate CoA-transferase BbsF subunit